jgi:hypothetical protein
MRAAPGSLRMAAAGRRAARSPRRGLLGLAHALALAACAAGCSDGPCASAVPPPDMSASVEVSPTVACAIAEQKELAGGLTWTAPPTGSIAMAGADGGSMPNFAITQNGFSANSECTTACSFNYNECFLPTAYLEAYLGAESATGSAGAGAAAGGTVGAGPDGGSACPDVASVTVTCTYTSAGFCE